MHIFSQCKANSSILVQDGEGSMDIYVYFSFPSDMIKIIKINCIYTYSYIKERESQNTYLNLFLKVH